MSHEPPAESSPWLRLSVREVIWVLSTVTAITVAFTLLKASTVSTAEKTTENSVDIDKLKDDASTQRTDIAVIKEQVNQISRTLTEQATTQTAFQQLTQSRLQDQQALLEKIQAIVVEIQREGHAHEAAPR